jgi:hypothetical protein
MNEELLQDSRAQCMACNGQLRLVAVLAPALGEPVIGYSNAKDAGTTSG